VKIYPVNLELRLALHQSDPEAADALETDMNGALLQEGEMLQFIQILILFKPMG